MNLEFKQELYKVCTAEHFEKDQRKEALQQLADKFYDQNVSELQVRKFGR